MAGERDDQLGMSLRANCKHILLVPARDLQGRVCAVFKFENRVNEREVAFDEADINSAIRLANAATGIIAPISKELEYQRAHEQGVDEARQQMMVELHSALQYVSMMVNTADRIYSHQENDDTFRTMAAELMKQAQQVHLDTRLILAGTRDETLVSDGLCAALVEYIALCGKVSGDQIIDFRPSGKPRRIHPAAEWALFMIARNAIENSLKHSQVRDMKRGAIWVRLTFHSDGNIVVHVEDNGQGFEHKKIVSGLGLRQMGDLARQIGAQLNITRGSSDESGTRVEVIYPSEAFSV